MSIKLRPLAVTDLSLVYAHNLGNGTIKHYKMPYSYMLTHTETPAAMVASYVEKTTGEKVEIISVLNEGSKENVIIEVPEVLEDLPNAQKQLKQAKIKNLIYQYIHIPYDLNHLWNFIAVPINSILNKINKLWANYKYGVDFYTEEGVFVYGIELFPRLIPTLSVKNKIRRMTPCVFLAIQFEESDRDKAIALIRKDIKILSDNDLIMGHLCLPSQLLLADIVGSDQKSYTIFCYLFIDMNKFGKIVGVENPLIRSEYIRLKGKNYRTELNYYLGLETQVEEGSVGSTVLDPINKYNIEYINICEEEREANQDAYIKSYEEQQQVIKKNNEILVKREKTRREEYKAQLEAKQGQPPLTINADAPTLISDRHKDSEE